MVWLGECRFSGVFIPFFTLLTHQVPRLLGNHDLNLRKASLMQMDHLILQIPKKIGLNVLYCQQFALS